MPYDLCEDDPTLDIIETAMANRGELAHIERNIPPRDSAYLFFETEILLGKNDFAAPHTNVEKDFSTVRGGLKLRFNGWNGLQ